MTNRVLIFGGRGGIGSATQQVFETQGYNVTVCGRDTLDLTDDQRDHLVDYLLDHEDPEVVINCAGVYSSRTNIRAEEMMAVNVGSNWSIIRHYASKPRPVRIIMVGSSAHRAGKPQHMLYAATKAAAHNLWQGAAEYFCDTPVRIDIVHPVRTRTQMVADTFDPVLDYLEPRDVAQHIYNLVAEDQASRCIELSFKEKS